MSMFAAYYITYLMLESTSDMSDQTELFKLKKIMEKIKMKHFARAESLNQVKLPKGLLVLLFRWSSSKRVFS